MAGLICGGCPRPPEQQVGFTRLGADSPAGPAALDPAQIVVAGTAAEAEALINLTNLPAAQAQQLRNLDFANELGVLVSRGAAGNPCYGITVAEIRLISGEMRLSVTLKDPLPNEICATVITYPYDLVRVSLRKNDLPAGTRWTVFAANDIVVAETVYPPRPSGLQTALAYHRVGGFAGTDDQVTIQPDGTIRTSGRLIGDRAGTLSTAELAELTALVQDWETLQTPPEGDPCCDFFTVSITYAGKTLTWTHPIRPPPEQLERLATRIEEIAQTIPPTNGP